MWRSVATLTPTVLAGGVLVAVANGATASLPAASDASARPPAEHVPLSVDRVRIAFRDTRDSSANQTIVLHGRRAQHLVVLFDDLKREPAGTAHCQAMSTSHTSVTFRGTSHKWVASEAICTNVVVTRDGSALPTLLESKAWNDALTHYLGHSPTAMVRSAPAQ